MPTFKDEESNHDKFNERNETDLPAEVLGVRPKFENQNERPSEARRASLSFRTTSGSFLRADLF